MTDIKVTQLPEVTTPTDDDILPIIDSPSSGATTKKITKANLVASTVATITAHTSRTDNPHTVTKARVGLGSAENIVDSAKPVSTATQTALDAKAALVHAHAQSDVTGLTCPGRLLRPVGSSGSPVGRVPGSDPGWSKRPGQVRNHGWRWVTQPRKHRLVHPDGTGNCHLPSGKPATIQAFSQSTLTGPRTHSPNASDCATMG